MGKLYEEWSDATPAFIPHMSISKYIHPEIPFSWKKVLKKEKNGFTAILLIFAGFDVLKKQIGVVSDVNGILLGFAVGSIFFYLIIKYIKKNTSLLDEDMR